MSSTNVERWREWVAKNLGGPPERQAAAMEAIIDGLRDRKGTDELARLARAAATDVPTGPQKTDRPVEAAFRDEAQPPGQSFRGIYDVVASDRSDLGRSTLAALKAVESKRKFPAKAFFSLRGFRGGYNFEGGSRLPITLILVVLLIASIIFVANAHLRVGATPVFLLFLLLLARALYVLIVTPLLAGRAEFTIADGRIIVSYGLLSTQQLVMELHWIREAGWSQTFLQKLLGEATLWINFDTASRGVVRQIFPGVVPVAQMQDFVDKLRNVAQKLRQGNYYARSFIG